MTMYVPLARSVSNFDPDTFDRQLVALRLDVQRNAIEQPFHQHRKGQLVLALRGGVTCIVPGAMWMVPPNHAVWIPGGMQHSNRATDNARICFLFIEPYAVKMPDKCCTLAISTMIRELITWLADQPAAYDPEGATARVASVLLEQLTTAPVEQLYLPVSHHPKLRHIIDALVADPGNRNTLVQWARQLAMSERTLARLGVHETGLTCGRWRYQLH